MGWTSWPIRHARYNRSSGFRAGQRSLRQTFGGSTGIRTSRANLQRTFRCISWRTSQVIYAPKKEALANIVSHATTCIATNVRCKYWESMLEKPEAPEHHAVAVMWWRPLQRRPPRGPGLLPRAPPHLLADRFDPGALDCTVTCPTNKEVRTHNLDEERAENVERRGPLSSRTLVPLPILPISLLPHHISFNRSSPSPGAEI